MRELASTPDGSVDSSPVGPAQAPVDVDGEAPVDTPSAGLSVELVPAFIASGDCSGSLGACENGSTVPCTVHCATRANGCEVSSEFVPLGTVDRNYYIRFGSIDPGGQWVLYAREWGGGDYESTPYRWSAAEGAVLLGEALGVPPKRGREESLYVLKVADGGASLLLQRIEPAEAYVWTRDAGLTALDLEPLDLSADGRVVAGRRGLVAVVWDRERGVRPMAGGALDTENASETGSPPLPATGVGDAGSLPTSATGVGDAGSPPFRVSSVRLSDTGELALVRGPDDRGFLWSEAGGMVPYETLPGFPAGARVEAADPNHPVLWVSTGDSLYFGPRRLWRWTEEDGALALGTLPATPPDARYAASMSLAGGRVVVGGANTPTRGTVAFRWSSELGMQQMSNAANSSAHYASSDGTTIVGYVNDNGTVSGSFRWTARGGASDVPGDVRGGIALGGDLLLARVWDGTNTGIRVLKYDSALANGGALPIDIIGAGLLPEGYELFSIDAISDNARLIAGTAHDAERRTHGWLLRLHDTCSP